ncbi:MAG: phage holin family protein [Hylemonella sp.]|nr:phage holin family protein [Hylemonella sp.]
MSETGQSQGLFASVRQLLSTVVETGQVRLSLLSNEIEQEKLRLYDSLLWIGVGLGLLGLGAQLLIAFIVVLFWDTDRLLILGALALLLLLGGAALLSMTRARLRKPGGLFNSTVEELRRDRVELGN